MLSATSNTEPRIIAPWLDERLGPNGQAIRLNFAAWFRQSKIVNAAGEPLRVYHGTDRDFAVFRVGSYFTGVSGQACDYAQTMAEDYGEGDAVVLPVYLRIENPAVVEDDFIEWAGSDPAEIEKLRAAGYDGMMNVIMTEIVPFSPEQIKSAIGNSGDYDLASACLVDLAPTPRPIQHARPGR